MLLAATTALQVASAVSNAKASKEEGKYQSAVAMNNAAIADANAAEADRDVITSVKNAEKAGFAGQRNAQQQDYRASEVIADVTSEQAVSGLEGGSQVRAIKTLRQLAGIDREAIITEGDAQAAGYRGQARSFELEAADLRSRAQIHRSDAKMAIAAGNNRARGYYLQAAGAVVGFATDMAKQGMGQMSGGGGSIGGSSSSFTPSLVSASRSSLSSPFKRAARNTRG